MAKANSGSPTRAPVQLVEEELDKLNGAALVDYIVGDQRAGSDIIDSQAGQVARKERLPAGAIRATGAKGQ